MNKKQKNIAIFGISPYSGNRGVGALAFSTIYLLDKIAEEEDCLFNYYIINYKYGDKKTDKLVIGNREIRIVNLWPLDLFRIKGIIKLFLQPQQWRTLFSFPKFDYFLNMGEGDSFSDIYGKNRFNSINNQNKMARLFGKKYVLLPQTIGPFVTPKIKAQAVKTINKAKLVLPRDGQSMGYVKNNTSQTNVFEVVDVAFFMPFSRQHFSSDFVHVGLNISSLLWHGGYTKNNQFNLATDYQKTVTSIIESFLKMPNVKLHLVPHVVNSIRHVENDYEVSCNLQREYQNERLILSPFFLDPIEAKSYISGLDFFMGARMHACIAAFSSEVPVFPMAYSRKFNGLFMDSLEYSHMGDMVNQSGDEILVEIQNAYNSRAELKASIKNRMTAVAMQREQVIRELITKIIVNKNV